MRSILPKAVRDLTQELTRLPGIGPKSAQRLAVHLLRQQPAVVKQFANTLINLHDGVSICSRCFNLSESELCLVCRDESRNVAQICVVEDALDVEAIEKTETYTGLYHVLGGVLSPMEGVGVDQLTLQELSARVATGEVEDREPTPEEQGKNPHAVRAGRLGGQKGGEARAKALTPKQRSTAAKRAARARWGKT